MYKQIKKGIAVGTIHHSIFGSWIERLNTNSNILENFKETTKVPYIKLQSSEGEVFTVGTEIAKKSGTIRNMLEEHVEEGDPNVNTYILIKAVVTSRSHCKPGFVDFLTVDQSLPFHIILADNFLEHTACMPI